MNVAVLGAGSVGGTLGRLWAAKGHSVTFGVPDPSGGKAKKALKDLNGARATNKREAAASADVIALCTPWPVAQDAVQSAGDLTGKILIDATNPLANDLRGPLVGDRKSTRLNSSQL